MWSTRPLYDGRYLVASPPVHASMQWEDVALLVARLALVALFLPSGMNKLLHMDQFVASLAQHALPYPKVFAGLAVMAEVGGSLMLLLGLMTRWAALLLFVFVLAATGISHRYWEYEPPQRQAQQINFQKNLAIAGGLLALSIAGGGIIGLDRRRRR
jgi:putative oxidoreductase